ncbi:MAG: universal stress protein [Candidatus Omnitrophica bacterium]|nr:universal stress protein [Candidatus Omnitrophota bacterium]
MKRFKNILLVSDLKPGGRSALERAVVLAERNQADLTIVDFINDLPKALRKIQADVFKVKKKHMEDAVASIQGNVSNVYCQILQGRSFVEIIRKVLRDKHDLVIIPAEGKTRFKEQIFGSTSMHLMRKCPCPVWVIKPTRRKKYFHILVAVELSELDNSRKLLNTKIMDLASSLAKWDQSDLHIIYAWKIYGESFLEGVSYDEMRKLDRETKNEYKKKMNLLLTNYELNKASTKVHINKGAAIDVIPAAVRKYHIDLIVMGTLCRTGLAGVLIGNTAEGVLQQVNCSVLTVKPDGFVSPIK